MTADRPWRTLRPGRVRRSLHARSLQTTLTATVAGLFVLATGTVLTVQLLVADRALDEQVQTMSLGSAPGPAALQAVPGPGAGAVSAPPDDQAEACAPTDATSCAPPGTTTDTDTQVGAADVSREVSTLRDEVSATMLTSSIILFAVFSVLALLAARLVATRTTHRIAALTALADGLDPTNPVDRLPPSVAADEIGRLTDTLNTALDGIERTVSAQRQFIANASHELLTPIAAIETSLGAPLSQGRFSADVTPAVQRALVSNGKSAELVRSLLELARAQSPARVGRRAVDLADVVDRALDGLADACAAKRLAIDTSGLRDTSGLGVIAERDHGGRGRTTVSADPVLLDLAVRNVLDNAIVHNTPEGRITVAVVRSTGTVTLAVTNTAPAGGTGVGSLVEPFQRGDSTRLAGTPGSGIGLAVVDAVARAHGGSLALSRPSPTTFAVRLTLPVEP